MNRRLLGFTLTEVLIVVAIISLMSAAIYVSVSGSSAVSRDAKRQADLRTLQTAIELYKNKYGRYPERCPSARQWSGEPGTDYACSSGANEYILGNSAAGRPFSEFILPLPRDPKLNGANSGYTYTTNADGTSYKIAVFRTVEEQLVYEAPAYTLNEELSHLRFCGGVNSSADACTQVNVAGWCGQGGTPCWCNTNQEKSYKSYALFGGYAYSTNDALIDRLTETVWCDSPTR